MRISDLRRMLSEILEVPGDSLELGKEIFTLKSEKRPPQDSLQVLILWRSTTLEGIWDGFEKVLRGSGRRLDTKPQRHDIEILLMATNRFFAPFLRNHIAKNHPNLREEIEREKQLFIEAINLLGERI